MSWQIMTLLTVSQQLTPTLIWLWSSVSGWEMLLMWLQWCKKETEQVERGPVGGRINIAELPSCVSTDLSYVMCVKLQDESHCSFSRRASFNIRRYSALLQRQPSTFTDTVPEQRRKHATLTYPSGVKTQVSIQQETTFSFVPDNLCDTVKQPWYILV